VDLLEPAVVRVARLERVAADALAPAEETFVDGWRLRFDGGASRRGSSALAETRGARPLARKLREVRAFYESRGVPPRLQLSPASRPAHLDEVLAARGWRREPGARVLWRGLAEPPPAPDLPHGAGDAAGPASGAFALAVAVAPDDGYLAVQRAVTPRAAGGAAARAAALREAGLRPWHLTLRDAAGRPIAAGLAVLDPRAARVGLFSVATLPDVRGRGHAGRLVRAALHRAREAGAAGAYLQVAAGNEAGLRLYRGLGFREHHRYHYRHAPEPDAAGGAGEGRTGG
jgi:ribosomal protein S18 acetylase RimI-like enzyme